MNSLRSVPAALAMLCRRPPTMTATAVTVRPMICEERFCVAILDCAGKG